MAGTGKHAGTCSRATAPSPCPALLASHLELHAHLRHLLLQRCRALVSIILQQMATRRRAVKFECDQRHVRRTTTFSPGRHQLCRATQHTYLKLLDDGAEVALPPLSLPKAICQVLQCCLLLLLAIRDGNRPSPTASSTATVRWPRLYRAPCSTRKVGDVSAGHAQSKWKAAEGQGMEGCPSSPSGRCSQSRSAGRCGHTCSVPARECPSSCPQPPTISTPLAPAAAPAWPAAWPPC